MAVLTWVRVDLVRQVSRTGVCGGEDCKDVSSATSSVASSKGDMVWVGLDQKRARQRRLGVKGGEEALRQECILKTGK